MKLFKVVALTVVLIMVGALLVLRMTGLPPGHPSAEDYMTAGRSARPGLWLKGEVVREAVTNWDWVSQFGDAFAENGSELETRTWYGIPHSVTVLLVPRGDGSLSRATIKAYGPGPKSFVVSLGNDLEKVVGESALEVADADTEMVQMI